jgi:hypothetical protein
VSGQVLLNGTPLPGGLVTFRPDNPKENSVTAQLDEQGRFSVELPVGGVKVSVDNRHLQERKESPAGLKPNLPFAEDVRQKLGGSGTPPSKEGEDKPSTPVGRYVPIAPEYHAVETSGLEFTVQRREQQHDIELRH